MALTRKFLKALGVSEEAIEEIITAHTDVTDELKTQLKTAQDVQKQLDAVTAERDDLQKKLNDPEQANRVAELEKQIAEYQNRETTAQKRTALTALLEKIGIDKRGFARVLTATDLDTIEMDGENIKGADKLAESLKSEWSDLITKPGETVKTPPTPPQNKPVTYTPDDIRRMSPAEINKNFDAIKASLKGE